MRNLIRVKPDLARRITANIAKLPVPMSFYHPHNDVSRKTFIKPGEEFCLYYDLKPHSADKKGLSLQD